MDDVVVSGCSSANAGRGIEETAVVVVAAMALNVETSAFLLETKRLGDVCCIASSCSWKLSDRD